MSKWPDNLRMYQAKFIALDYITSNAWKYFEAPLAAGDWAGLPIDDCLEHLNQYHKNSLIKAFRNMAAESAKQAYTIDDLITDLDWHFNPDDIAHLKMNYNPPHHNKYRKKVKVHNGS